LESIEKELREYIVETFLFGQGGEDLKNDDSLLEMGIVDSTGVLEIVAFLDEKWQLTVEDEELIPENFDSIGRLVAFIEKKMAQAAE
jgi:acyl carrier protein